MFARSPRFLADLSLPTFSSSHNVSHYYHTITQFIEHAKIAARRHNIQHQQVSEQRYDRNRSNPEYFVGQSVLICNRNLHTNKFSSRCIGSYTIFHRLHDKIYIVKNENTKHSKQVPV